MTRFHAQDSFLRRKLDAKLSTWISKKRISAKQGCLEPEKIIELVKVGANMNGYSSSKSSNGDRAKIPKCIIDKSWNNKFNQLEEFKRVYGHCIVTKSHDGKLADWVYFQRKRYRKLLNKENKIDQGEEEYDDEWVKKLDCIGFDWNPPQYNKKLKRISIRKLKSIQCCCLFKLAM